jgi:hypothetical protein
MDELFLDEDCSDCICEPDFFHLFHKEPSGEDITYRSGYCHGFKDGKNHSKKWIKEALFNDYELGYIDGYSDARKHKSFLPDGNVSELTKLELEEEAKLSSDLLSETIPIISVSLAINKTNAYQMGYEDGFDSAQKNLLLQPSDDEYLNGYNDGFRDFLIL